MGTPPPIVPSAPASAPASAPVARSGRGGVALAAILALAVAGGLLAAFLIQRSSALDWRDRARVEEVRSRQLAAQLDQVQDDLQVTQDRLAAIAAEKANVGDEREALQRIVLAAPSVTRAIDDCNAALGEVERQLDAPPGGQPPSLGPLGAALDDAVAFCDDAQSLADELERELDDLGI